MWRDIQNGDGKGFIGRQIFLFNITPELPLGRTLIINILLIFPSAVKENLERTGDLQKLKAEVRANIIKILDPNPTQVNKPEAPEETLLILGLISEFLEWHGYTYSAQFLFEGIIVLFCFIILVLIIGY